MSYYQKHTDEDLFEAYQSMVDYSGKPNNELADEIERRGGMAHFINKLNAYEEKKKEKKKIAEEVYSLYKQQYSLPLIKSQVKSSLFSEKELHVLIEENFNRFGQHEADVSINNNTVLRCAISFIVTTFIGSVAWGYALKHFGSFIFIVLSIISVLLMILTQLFVGKTTSNLLVFITGFLSIVASYFVGLFLIPYLP